MQKNKIILGINFNHADSAAVIIKNNKLCFGVEEEKLNRIKHWAGIPFMAIEECLNKTNTNSSEITDISINTNPISNINHKTFYFFKNYLFGKKKIEFLNRLKKKFNLKKILINKFNFSNNINFHYVDHHLSHIYSGFIPSNFKKALVVSVDGFGDFASVVISECEKRNKIKVLKKILFPSSLGVFYESFTQFLGFKYYGEEYKVMALACFGKPIYFETIIKNIFINGECELNLKFFNHHKSNYSYQFQGTPVQSPLYDEKKFENLFGSNKDFDKSNPTQKQFDIASSAQKVFEYFLTNLIKQNLKINFSNNIVLTGGCALNSLANGKLLEKENFNIFIPYSPGDAGGAIGSAIYTSINKYNSIPENLISPYLGPRYSIQSIEKSINIRKEKNFTKNLINEENNLNNKISDLLINNKVGGIFFGSLEYGARALGNRSIIANPTHLKMKEIINLKIKKRENFRPFAPSILAEHKSSWFEKNNLNMYMSMVETIKLEKRKLIPAVTHIDGTGRVQTVSKNLNSKFYNLIFNFYQKTNVPILLNTSFNENEPIVNTPEQALDCFFRTDIDFLVLENYLIIKN